jgi:putative ABC transport system permease protein
MGSAALWVRWSLRDLRQRWLQVGALSAVIAIGVGAWSGLSGTAAWRRASNDASLAALDVHDLRVSLAAGSFVPQGALTAALAPLVAARAVTGAEERLVVGTQVDASTPGHTVLAPGQLVGVDLAAGPAIDRFSVRAGHGLGATTAVLDAHFATHQHLAPAGALALSGGIRLDYVGQVLTPDHFVVVASRASVFAGEWFAVVYTSLAVAQRASGHAGSVNEAVLRVAPGTDRAALAAQVRRVVTSALPGVGVTVTVFSDEVVHHYLYDTIGSDQHFYDIFAMLIFAGAIFGAFNLAKRMVDAQRREIGIGMALGVGPANLAIRPMLVGVEIALVGTAGGVGAGLVINQALRSLFAHYLPLPVWRTSTDWAAFGRGALAGIAIPLVGLAWPVFRALRVSPHDTMTPLYRTRARRAPRLGHRLVLPGSTLSRMPIRNVLRSLQRTLLTVAAVGAATAVFFTVLGLLDSFRATIATGERAAEAGAPQRVTVDLEQVGLTSSATVAAVRAAPGVAAVSGALRLPGTLAGPHLPKGFNVMIEVRDLTGGLWRPQLHPALGPTTAPGVVLARKAARDLGVGIGGSIQLTYPRRSGVASFTYVTATLPVLAVHDIPLRTEVLIDASHADLFAMDGLTNALDVVPRSGVGIDQLKRTLFVVPGVASVQGVAETVQTYRSLLDSMMGFLAIVEAATLVLVALVAFNATSINADERRREHATMLAFGVRVRAVLGTMVAENVILGALGGLVGAGIGVVLVHWVLRVSIPAAMPDVAVAPTINVASAASAIAAAVATVAATPLTALRRLRRLDVASTLRVVE